VGINDEGIVTGSSYSDEYASNAVIWDQDGRLRRIGPDLRGVRSIAINNSGMVLGDAYVHDDLNLFIWTESEGTEFVDLSNGGEPFRHVDIVSADLNESGRIAATYRYTRPDLTSSFGISVRSEAGEITEIALPEGAEPLQIRINEPGTVIFNTVTSGTVDGELVSELESFVWSEADGVRDLPRFGGEHSSAKAMNDLGLVLMSEFDEGDFLFETKRDFLFDTVTGETLELTDLVRTLTGFERYELVDLNNAGQIIGIGYENIFGQSIGFILTIPAPGAFLVFTLGGAGAFMRRRR